MPCFGILPPNFIYKCSMVHCRRFAPMLFSHGENNRADDSRPYTDGATKFHLQNVWHCIVGAFAPTLFPHGENNRADDSRPYTDGANKLHLLMFVTAIVGANAPTLFSPWENNRADDIRPYMACAIRWAGKIFEVAKEPPRAVCSGGCMIQPGHTASVRSQRRVTRCWPPRVQVKRVRSQSPAVIWEMS